MGTSHEKALKAYAITTTFSGRKIKWWCVIL